VLAVIGASHHDLELADLERLSAGPELQAALGELAGRPGSSVSGWVLLATCNRLEIYLDTVQFHDAIDDVVDLVATAARLPRSEVSGLLQVRAGSPVAAHLFGVAAGLDSMVVGEAEISGQVSAALRHAQAGGSATPVLHLLFQSAARAAKRIATHTELGAAGRSVATVALELAERRVGPLADTSVVLIGTGAYARVVAAALRDRNCFRVAVYSRSGRQAAFAARRGLRAVTTAELPRVLADSGLVVSCSGTGTTVLDAALVGPLLAERGRPLCVVDLALHQDVPTEVRQLAGIEVIDLTTTAALAAEGASGPAVSAAAELVLQAVSDFERDLAARRLEPAVIALREHVTGTVQRELARLLSRVPPEVAAEVEHAAHRMTRSLLHTPTIRARMLARSGDETDYLRALHTLFGIDVADAADDDRG
jgi:glutamyl-tRNA reductase